MAQILSTKVTINWGSTNITSKLQTQSEPTAIITDVIVVDGASDSGLNFEGIVTAEIFYIESDRQISYRFASGGTVHTLKANGFHFYMLTSFTQLLLSNSSGANAVVRILIGGT